MKTIVGLYKTVEQANRVKSMLTSQGYDGDNITVIDQSENGYNTGSSTSTGYNTTDANQNTVGGRIKHFFSSLSGSDDAAHNSYAQGVSGGGALLAVKAQDNQAEEVADLLQQNGASEIEGGAGSGGYGAGSYGSGVGASSTNTLGADAGDRDYGTGTGTLAAASSTGTAGTSGSYASNAAGTTGSGYEGMTGRAEGEQVIPIVEENLEVGKRQVQRGGVRVYTHVVEEPVSETVNLHEERVVVDRRPVDRAATNADFNTGSDVLELTATGEEAVVGKRSRVVEEIRVGKEGSDRSEQINDTVRHTEVDVEQIAGDTTGVGSGSKTRTTGSGNDRF